MASEPRRLSPRNAKAFRLRYCARPPFALERLELLDAERVIYRLPKPQRGGSTALILTPLELIDHLAAQLAHSLAAAQAASPSLPKP